MGTAQAVNAVDMWTCVQDSDCAVFGDARSQCLNTGRCLCSTGYSSFRGGQAAGSEFFGCISDVEPTTVTNARWIEVVISLSFGQFSTCTDTTVTSWSDLFLHHIESILRRQASTRTTPDPSHVGIPLWQNVTQVNHFCTPVTPVVTSTVTGIDSVILATVTIGDLYSLFPTFETTLQARLNADPVLYPIFGRPAGDNTVDAVAIAYSYAHTRSGSQRLCPVDQANGQYVSASFIPDLTRTATPVATSVKCRLSKCHAGFDYSLTGCAVTPTPVPPVSDDDLSTGALVGIIVGAVCGLCIIILIIYCCCCRSSDDKEEM